MKMGTAHVSFQVERWPMTHETYLVKVGTVSPAFASLLDQHQSSCIRKAKGLFISSLVQYTKTYLILFYAPISIKNSHMLSALGYAISTQIR